MSEDAPLSINLQQYKAALQAEFELGKYGTSDELADVAKERLALLLPEASETLASILHNGTKDDTVRLNAVKMIFEYTIGRPVAKTTDESDINKIINGLMQAPAPTTSELEG